MISDKTLLEKTWGKELASLSEHDRNRVMKMSFADRQRDIERIRKYMEIEKKNAERRRWR